jgi:hypothetical protein
MPQKKYIEIIEALFKSKVKEPRVVLKKLLEKMIEQPSWGSSLFSHSKPIVHIKLAVDLINHCDIDKDGMFAVFRSINLYSHAFNKNDEFIILMNVFFSYYPEYMSLLAGQYQHENLFVPDFTWIHHKFSINRNAQTLSFGFYALDEKQRNKAASFFVAEARNRHDEGCSSWYAELLIRNYDAFSKKQQIEIYESLLRHIQADKSFQYDMDLYFLEALFNRIDTKQLQRFIDIALNSINVKVLDKKDINKYKNAVNILKYAAKFILNNDLKNQVYNKIYSFFLLSLASPRNHQAPVSFYALQGMLSIIEPGSEKACSIMMALKRAEYRCIFSPIKGSSYNADEYSFNDVDHLCSLISKEKQTHFVSELLDIIKKPSITWPIYDSYFVILRGFLIHADNDLKNKIISALCEFISSERITSNHTRGRYSYSCDPKGIWACVKAALECASPEQHVQLEKSLSLLSNKIMYYPSIIPSFASVVSVISDSLRQLIIKNIFVSVSEQRYDAYDKDQIVSDLDKYTSYFSESQRREYMACLLKGVNDPYSHSIDIVGMFIGIGGNLTSLAELRSMIDSLQAADASYKDIKCQRSLFGLIISALSNPMIVNELYQAGSDKSKLALIHFVCQEFLKLKDIFYDLRYSNNLTKLPLMLSAGIKLFKVAPFSQKSQLLKVVADYFGYLKSVDIREIVAPLNDYEKISLMRESDERGHAINFLYLSTLVDTELFKVLNAGNPKILLKEVVSIVSSYAENLSCIM